MTHQQASLYSQVNQRRGNSSDLPPSITQTRHRVPTVVHQYRRPAPINYNWNNSGRGRGGFRGKGRGGRSDNRRGKRGRNEEQGSSTGNTVPDIPAPVIAPQDPIITPAVNEPAPSEIDDFLNEFANTDLASNSGDVVMINGVASEGDFTV